MRTIGNVVLLLLLALFGFGFLSAYTLKLSQELAATKDQLAQTQAKMKTLESQYQTLVDEKDKMAGQISELSNENASLKAQIGFLMNERETLVQQIETLQKKQNMMEKTYPLLAQLNSPSMGNLAILFGLPVLPISFGAIYLISHSTKKNLSIAQKKVSKQGPIMLQALLTREEILLVSRHRRSLANKPNQAG